MSQTEKDSGIRLFGRKIPVPECQIPANSEPTDAHNGLKKTKVETPCAETPEQQNNSSDLSDGKQESQHALKENGPVMNPKPVEDNIDTDTDSTDQDKTLKKPDKILQCPRCNSLETKFCYFNNYNVNQPRHFCKNCQRYWTAGGTMRNVPIGAGRRKNKHLASQFRHIIVNSDGIPTSRLDTLDSSTHQHISSIESSATDNATVLKFGPDSCVSTFMCESMESMLNLRDQKRSIDSNSIRCAEYGDEPSLCRPSVTNAGAQRNELSEQNTSSWLQCYPIPPWALPLNSGWNNVAPMSSVHPSSTAATMQWCPSPMVAIPNIPLHLLSASYWGGMPVQAAGAGTVSIGPSACLSPSSSNSNSCCLGNGSPTLGKHTRDAVFADEEGPEKCVLVPKSIRIDDPNEASKSPLRATLAFKPDKQQNMKPKGDGTDGVLGASRILEANPAAISRAHVFQESM